MCVCTQVLLVVLWHCRLLVSVLPDGKSHHHLPFPRHLSLRADDVLRLYDTRLDSWELKRSIHARDVGWAVVVRIAKGELGPFVHCLLRALPFGYCPFVCPLCVARPCFVPSSPHLISSSLCSRGLTSTVAQDTCYSPNQEYLIYSSWSPAIRLITLEGDRHEDLVRCCM